MTAPRATTTDPPRASAGLSARAGPHAPMPRGRGAAGAGGARARGRWRAEHQRAARRALMAHAARATIVDVYAALYLLLLAPLALRVRRPAESRIHFWLV